MTKPPSNKATETTSVIISGGGPTGALLSALLGQLKVPNVVLEREASINTDPRGIALDEDGIRLVQAVGMYERVHTRIGSCAWVATLRFLTCLQARLVGMLSQLGFCF